VVAELQERFGTGVVVDLIKGNRGVFDVHVDGRLVFSKHQLHRFPDAGEIVGLAATPP
jgi:selT/selW/selH-like putative selenoprotein